MGAQRVPSSKVPRKVPLQVSLTVFLKLSPQALRNIEDVAYIIWYRQGTAKGLAKDVSKGMSESKPLGHSPTAAVPVEMSGHDSGVHVGGNDHSACAAQTAEERNLPEFVNGRVVCHHLVRLQTQTFIIIVCRYISNLTEASHRDSPETP